MSTMAALGKRLYAPASASSWGQSVGQVSLSGSNRGLASNLGVYAAKMEKGTASTAVQPITHNRWNMSFCGNSLFPSWKCLSISRMTF